MAGGVEPANNEVVSDINIVPLVDVILVLLIVFMITMPTIVGSAPIKVDLPVTDNVANVAAAIPLHFALKKAESGVVLYLEDSPTNLAKLTSLVKDIDTQVTEVSLAVDRGISYDEVVSVMDMLSSLGLHKIALDTKHRR